MGHGLSESWVTGQVGHRSSGPWVSLATGQVNHGSSRSRGEWAMDQIGHGSSQVGHRSSGS